MLLRSGRGGIVPVRRKALKFRIMLEPGEEGGYTAILPPLLGCISEGDTRDEALANIREAIQLYLEPVEDDSHLPANSEVIEISMGLWG